MKSPGAVFRAFLAEILDEMSLKSIVVDPDICYSEATKSDCEEYYEYILVYVDNMLAISLDAQSIILEVAETF